MPPSASSPRTARASRSGRRGGTCTPVTPSTTVSANPPTAAATTGTPHAIASNATVPNGSCQGTHTAASADRSRAGMRSTGTGPSSRSRLATPAAPACATNRRASG
jgi:hypothetical protein